MIRLIASDLDGTLLDPAGNLPEDAFPAIEKLYQAGIVFCAASGRQLTALHAMFRPVADKILIMAENGAIVAHQGKILRCDTLPATSIRRALNAVFSIPHTHALLCTPECAYYQEEAYPFLDYVRASYISNRRRDLGEVARTEKVCKIAVYDEAGPENNGMRVLPSHLSDLRVIQSGGNWLDISEPDANKGCAMRFIRETFHFQKDECVAFGDHMNDFEMLSECGHPYLTENAYPPLRKHFQSTVPSNAKNGVVPAMFSLAEGRRP